jgi:hypothetical protein
MDRMRKLDSRAYGAEQSKPVAYVPAFPKQMLPTSVLWREKEKRILTREGTKLTLTPLY